MTLSTYLTFDGNCREVFEFYRSVFGGDFEVIQTFGDGPDEMPVPGDERRPRHARLVPHRHERADGQRLPVLVPRGHADRQTTSRSLPLDQPRGDGRVLRQDLGGRVVVAPLEEMFWGAYFGACTDKFGINWQFNCELQPPDSA